MDNKIVGYIFIIVGVVIIAFSALSVYSVFTGQSEPYNLFNFDGISLPVSSLLGPEMAAAGDVPDVELVKPEMLNSTTNTLSHLLLMGFLASVGYRIAMIGANLVRPIVIKTNGKKIQSIEKINEQK